MNEEIKTTQEEKNNKGIIIIVFILILILAIGGPLIAYKILLDETPTNEKTPIIEEETDEQDEEDDDYGDITIPEEIPDSQLDQIFKKLVFTQDNEAKLDLIDSSSCPNCMSENLLGAMINENISDEYKLVYTLSKATWQAFDEEYDLMESNYNNKVTIKKETIEKLANQIFADFKFPTSITKDTWYYGIYDITCTTETCSYSYSTFGAIGVMREGYLLKTNETINLIEAQVIYLEVEDAKMSETDDNKVVGNFKLYQTHNGVLVTELKDFEIEPSSSEHDTKEFDTFSKYFSKIDTYKYGFDKENRLKTVTKK